MIDLKRYTKKLVIYSGIVFLVSVAFRLLASEKAISDAFFLMVPFYFVLGLLSRYVIIGKGKNNPNRGAFAKLIVSFIRMFLCILIMVLYSLSFPHDAYAFMITFFIYYILFVGFELVIQHRFDKH